MPTTRSLASFALLATLTSAGPAFAMSGHGHDAAHGATMPVADAGAKASLSEGTVKKVDKAAGKITINHGPLENLGMPPMTMTFRATDPSMLDAVSEGDRIRFAAQRIDGVFSVTKLEVVK
ncbi:copper-binding protein [Aromatoleum aromaticum]|uniref:copper-binding protein n=1 Tax=Aromatoleum aromaticum TaxID=551760 RepID=UPI0014598524|nr:copper-binding protein [Aromatoleum aromaticum]NMG56898.1 RND transporter [Aromatoleum aromaticum]